MPGGGGGQWIRCENYPKQNKHKLKQAIRPCQGGGYDGSGAKATRNKTKSVETNIRFTPGGGGWDPYGNGQRKNKKTLT